MTVTERAQWVGPDPTVAGQPTALIGGIDGSTAHMATVRMRHCYKDNVKFLRLNA